MMCMTDKLHVGFQEYLHGLCLKDLFHLFAFILTALQTDSSHPVIQLHFDKSSALIGHGGPHIHRFPLKLHPRAVGLVAHKAVLIVVVHALEQTLVAGLRLIEDAHPQPVLVEVVVERHREHDSHELRAGALFHVEHLVGQDAHGA